MKDSWGEGGRKEQERKEMMRGDGDRACWTILEDPSHSLACPSREFPVRYIPSLAEVGHVTEGSSPCSPAGKTPSTGSPGSSAQSPSEKTEPVTC